MPDEQLIAKWEELLSDMVAEAGKAEQTRIIPNLQVVDASPSGLTGYVIIAGGPGGSFYGPALKVPGITYTNGDLVNVLFIKGTEPIAFQQGSGSSGTSGYWIQSGNNIYYATGYVGIGGVPLTTGAQGVLQLFGTDSSAAGPFITTYTDADSYPVIQVVPYTHDDNAILFDAYFDGSTYRSSDTSNFAIRKTSGVMYFLTDSGITAGNAVSWDFAFALQISNGNMAFGSSSPSSTTKLLVAGSVASNATLYGLRTTTSLDPGNGLNAVMGYIDGTVVATAAETVASAINLQLPALTKSGTGTITNAIGLSVTTPTIGTNNYGAQIGAPVIIGGTTRQASDSRLEVHNSDTISRIVNYNSGDTSAERDVIYSAYHSNGQGGYLTFFRDASNSNGMSLAVGTEPTTGGGPVNRLVIGPSGATDFYVGSSSVQMLTMTSSAQYEVVVNEGSADVDFRVESDTLTSALFVRGSDGRVGINTSSPTNVSGDPSGIVCHLVSTGDTFPAYKMERSGGSSYTDRQWAFGVATAGDWFLQDVTAPGNRVLVDTSGRWSIGSSVADAVSSRLQVAGLQSANEGFRHWSHNAVAGTALVIVTNSTTNLRVRFDYMAWSAGESGGGSNTVGLGNGGTNDLTIGSSTWQFRVNSAGDFDIRRTAGSSTLQISLSVVWIKYS